MAELSYFNLRNLWYQRIRIIFLFDVVDKIAFEFRDVDAIYKKLKINRYTLKAGNGISARYFFVKDPDNILVEIYKSYK